MFVIGGGMLLGAKVLRVVLRRRQGESASGFARAQGARRDGAR